LYLKLWLWISLLIAELQNKSRKTPEIRSSSFPQLKYGGMHNQDASTFMVCRGWHWIPCLCILLFKGKLSGLYCHVSRLRLLHFKWGSWKNYSGVSVIFQFGYVQHNCQSFCITWFTGTYPLGLLSHVYITGCAKILGVHTLILSHGKEICLRCVEISGKETKHSWLEAASTVGCKSAAAATAISQRNFMPILGCL
jgi:hypothetical protein